jgi:hypothetical protein
LKPWNVAEPEFDTVVSRFLNQLETLFKTPTLWDHIVADGFFHGTSLFPMRALRAFDVESVP